MIKKKAFTLVELMATLAIFSIGVVLVGGVLVYGQKQLNRTDERVEIQNEIRLALYKIQAESEKADKINVTDKRVKIENNRLIIDEQAEHAREIFRLGYLDVNKVYVEINYNNKHQLIEFNINKVTDKIEENSFKVVIDSIEGEGIESIKVSTEDSIDISGNIKNEMITLNFSGVVKGNNINNNEYIATLNNKKEKIIEINGDGSISSGSGDENNNNNKPGLEDGENTQGNGENNNINGLSVNLDINKYWNGGGEWQINITNNTSNTIKKWSIEFDYIQDCSISVWEGWAILEYMNNGYRMNSNSWDNIFNNYQSVITPGETIFICGNFDGNIYNKEINVRKVSYE